MTFRAAILTLAIGLLFVPPSHAISLGQLDDFQSGTVEGWSGGANPIVALDSGPTGNGDHTLKLTSTNRIGTFNISADWTGDYLAAGVDGIEADFLWTDPDPLEMRIVLFSSGISTRWTSTESLPLAGDGEWHRLKFSLAEDSITRVRGSDSFDTTNANVTRLLIRHQSGAPEADGTPQLGELLIDNIVATQFLADVFGDFNSDRIADDKDIDALVAEIARAGSDPTFDLDENGSVDSADLDSWLSGVAMANGFGEPYSRGDANLDGAVSAADLNRLGIRWQQTGAGWSGGDFTADGIVNAADLNALGVNWQSAIDMAADRNLAVPEPSSVVLLLMSLAGLFPRRTNQTRTLGG